MNKRRENMEYGKITKEEKLELDNLVLKSASIEALFKRLLIEQENYNKDREKWFMNLREKYNIPLEISIQIQENGNIIENVE
jgi:hypothetical protein